MNFKNIYQIEDYLFNNICVKKNNDFYIALKLILNDNKIFNKFKFIHVTGTNGKGSVSTYISKFLEVHDIKCGLFTSPHILNITERIKYRDKNISDKDFINIFNKIFNQTNKLRLSFFDYLFLICLYYFNDLSLDVIILEVGIGGEKDITNIIPSKIAAVITYIDYDHIEIFNDNLNLIIKEKLNIINKNTKNVFLGNENKQQVLKIIKNKQIKIKFNFFKFGKDYYYKNNFFVFFNKKIKIEKKLPIYQYYNISEALGCLYIILNEYNRKINLYKLKKIIENTKLILRFQKINIYQHTCIFDGAHNISGIRILLKTIDMLYKNKKIIFIYSSMKNKPYDKILNILKKKGKVYLYNFNKYVKNNSMDINNFSFKKIHSFAHLKNLLKFKIDKENLIIFTGSIYFTSYIIKNFMLEKVINYEN